MIQALRFHLPGGSVRRGCISAGCRSSPEMDYWTPVAAGSRDRKSTRPLLEGRPCIFARDECVYVNV